MMFFVFYLCMSLAIFATMLAACTRRTRHLVFQPPRRRWVFYLLSLTWGLPATLIGAIMALFVALFGAPYKFQRYGWCWMFEMPGIDWGLNMGLFLVAPSNITWIKKHEVGHAVQNCYLGIFMPAVVLIPSLIRFWFRKLITTLGHPPRSNYSDIWFEHSADTSGQALMEALEAEKKS